MQVLNNRLPDLPPLIENAGVFVYFVPANLVVNQIHHAADGLSPWTVDRMFFFQNRSATY